MNTEDYDEFDRLQAEAEIRMSIALPLSAIIVVALTYIPGLWSSVDSSTVFVSTPAGIIVALIGAVLVALVFFGFLARAMQKFSEANGVLTDAIASGTISSPTLSALAELTKSVPVHTRLIRRIQSKHARSPDGERSAGWARPPT